MPCTMPAMHCDRAGKRAAILALHPCARWLCKSVWEPWCNPLKQVENELKEVDAKFSRLHGVPAGRALDLYGRVIGGPVTASPEAAPAARKQGSRTRGHASALKCGLADPR